MEKNNYFSVIIPTYNRQKSIIRLLRKLSEQKYKNFEVIIIDGNPKNRSVCPVTGIDFSLDTGLDMKVILQDNENNPGLANARNIGVSNAKYDYLVFIDSDCVPLFPDWLECINKTVSELDNDFVLGGRVTLPKNTLFKRFLSFGLNGYGTPDQGPFRYMRRKNFNKFETFPTTNLIISKQTFDLVGGFDSNFKVSGEDVDLCVRLWEAGVTFVYNPSFPILHYHRSGLMDMCKTSFKRQSNHTYFIKKYGYNSIFFKRRVIKTAIFYTTVIFLFISRIPEIYLTLGYMLLFIEFYLRSRSITDSMIYPAYYILFSICETFGFTKSILKAAV